MACGLYPKDGVPDRGYRPAQLDLPDPVGAYDGAVVAVFLRGAADGSRECRAAYRQAEHPGDDLLLVDSPEGKAVGAVCYRARDIDGGDAVYAAVMSSLISDKIK